MTGRLMRALPVAALLAVSLAAPAAAAVINGTNGPDVLVGTAGADTIHGYRGADTIYGKGGADYIYGGRDIKRDTLYGGLGNDHIYVGVGDLVYAGSGNDVIRVTSGGAMKTIFIYCGPGYDHVYSGAAVAAWLLKTTNCEKINGVLHRVGAGQQEGHVESKERRGSSGWGGRAGEVSPPGPISRQCDGCVGG